MAPILDTPFDSAVWLPPLLPQLPAAVGSPQLLFLAGGPLTGKSTVALARLRAGDPLVPPDAVPVHPRFIREELPEFGEAVRHGDPDAAVLVRAEVEDIARQLVLRVAGAGRNAVIHGLGAGAPGAFATVLRTFADRGYRVRVLLVDADTDVCLRRNAARAEQTGLAYDEATIRRLHAEVSRRFGDWERLPGVGWDMVANDG